MAKKITDLSALTSVAVGDLVHIIDISDTTDDAAGSSRKITVANLTAGSQPLNANLTALTTVFSAASASGPATLAFHEDTDNGSNKVTLSAPSSVASDVTVTLPGTADTLVGRDTTDTLTNKTLTSPKVGTAIADTNGNELFKVTATASAVNEFTVANAATGNDPTLSATGGDTNIGINITPKGTGVTKIGTSCRARAYLAANQSVNSGVLTRVTLNTESFDPGSNFDNATNYRFTAPVTGYYFITAQVSILSPVDQTIIQIDLLKNASDFLRAAEVASGTNTVAAKVTDVALLTAGDYLELNCTHTSGSAKNISGGSGMTYMSIHLISV